MTEESGAVVVSDDEADQPNERDDQPLHDDHEALVTECYYYAPRQHSALWDVFSVDSITDAGVQLREHVGTQRPVRDHRNVFRRGERDLVRRQAAAAIAGVLGLSDPSFDTLRAQELELESASGRIVRRDHSGPLYLRKQQYSGGTIFDGYIVTEPVDNVVDVYEDDTWRLLGSYELPPDLRVDDDSDGARLARWSEAVAGLRLYSNTHTQWLCAHVTREPSPPRTPPDPAQLEFDFGDFEPRPWACAAIAAVRERAS